jgi:hypothetical protein
VLFKDILPCAVAHNVAAENVVENSHLMLVIWRLINGRRCFGKIGRFIGFDLGTLLNEVQEILEIGVFQDQLLYSFLATHSKVIQNRTSSFAGASGVSVTIVQSIPFFGEFPKGRKVRFCGCSNIARRLESVVVVLVCKKL